MRHHPRSGKWYSVFRCLFETFHDCFITSFKDLLGKQVHSSLFLIGDFIRDANSCNQHELACIPIAAALATAWSKMKFLHFSIALLHFIKNRSWRENHAVCSKTTKKCCYLSFCFMSIYGHKNYGRSTNTVIIRRCCFTLRGIKWTSDDDNDG